MTDSTTIPTVPRIARRTFLQQTAAGLAAANAPWPARADDGIPPHEAIRVPGLHAYAQRSVQTGETVDFRVSSDTPYALAVSRTASDATIATLAERRPQTQALHVGSYVHSDPGFAGRRFDALSLEAWVRTWSSERRQGILTACDGDRGFGLFVSRGGWVEFLLGRWRVMHAPLTVKKWRHVVISWDGAVASVFVDGLFQGSWEQVALADLGNAPVRLGAAGESGRAAHFLDGDIAMPAVYDRPLSAEEAMERFRARALVPPTGKVVAFWPLDEERGDRVRDAAGSRHGRIVNRATWMIGGPSFDAAGVPRYGDYDPKADRLRGHGLRFASDELYDCRWDATHSVEIPREATPGVYTGRFRFRRGGKRLRYDVTFLVRRSPDRPKAPMLMLCSSNTWQAYSATPFAVNSAEPFWGTAGQANAHPAAPAYCCYRNHAQGQPTYAIGMKMPWPVAGPEVTFSRDDFGYSHLMRGELFAHRWLEETGYRYDVASDHDLHRDPLQLEGYKVVVINGHSEYWSEEAYRAVDAFLRDGGAAIVMSGNTMFWRVSYDEDGTAMECRKHGVDIGGRADAHVGEIYHSHDGRRGSLMRFCGLPAWKVLGLECIGWWPVNEPHFGAYRLADPSHFLFNEPEPVGMREGETFGEAPDGRPPRVGGHESDVRPSLIRAITRQNPTAGPVPDDPPGIVPLAQVVDKDRRGLDYFGRWEPLRHGVYAEMIYWERPQGGKVFHTGCIAGGWALSADPRMQVVMRNALHHFGVQRQG